MARFECAQCHNVTDRWKPKCVRCGSAQPVSRARAIGGALTILLILGTCGAVVSAAGHPTSPQAGATGPGPIVLPSGPWKEGTWVAQFRRISQNPNAVKPYSRTKDPDGPVYTYDFSSFQKDAVGTLTTIAAKKNGWRWQLGA
jgi:hypothetical protein